MTENNNNNGNVAVGQADGVLLAHDCGRFTAEADAPTLTHCMRRAVSRGADLYTYDAATRRCRISKLPPRQGSVSALRTTSGRFFRLPQRQLPRRDGVDDADWTVRSRANVASADADAALQACQESCARDPDCAAYVFTHGTQDSGRAWCWTRRRTAAPTATTGAIARPTQPHPTSTSHGDNDDEFGAPRNGTTTSTYDTAAPGSTLGSGTATTFDKALDKAVEQQKPVAQDATSKPRATWQGTVVLGVLIAVTAGVTLYLYIMRRRAASRGPMAAAAAALPSSSAVAAATVAAQQHQQP